MIHLLNEGGNSTLIRRKVKAPLGKEIKKHLLQIYNNFDGDKGSKGFQRLSNVLNMDKEDGGINYNELTQLSHIMNKILPKSEEFKTLGGDLMKSWVDISLKSMENNDRADKQARKNAGEQNAFRKSHTKDRQNKRKNKPTIGRFQTKNASKAIGNNEFIKLSETLEQKTIIISESQANYIKENN
jgi:hypothetical protein